MLPKFVRIVRRIGLRLPSLRCQGMLREPHCTGREVVYDEFCTVFSGREAGRYGGGW